MYRNLENTLPDNVLLIELDTDGPVRAEDTLIWAHRIIAFLQSIEVGDGEPDIEIRHLGHGSTSLELLFLGMVAIAGVGMFALKLEEAIRSDDTQVASATRIFADDFSAENLTIACAHRDPIVIPVSKIPEGNKTLSGWDQSPFDTKPYDGDPIGGDSNSPVVEEEADIEFAGRVVTINGGRAAVFRTENEEFEVSAPDDLFKTVPIGEDIIVTVPYFSGATVSLDVSNWRFANDDEIDWENDEGLPGVQAQKLEALERRDEWKDSAGSGEETAQDLSYDELIPDLDSDNYPSPSDLSPALSKDLRVVDAADAHLKKYRQLYGRFSKADNGVIYFGDDKVYGPVSNPDVVEITDQPVLVVLDVIARDEKIYFTVHKTETFDSF